MKFRLIIFISIAGAFTSCTPLYVSNPLPAHIFNNAGEIQAGGSYGNNGTNIYGAYSVSQDTSNGLGMAVMGNFTGESKEYINDKGVSTGFTKYQHNYAEAGIGMNIKTSEVKSPFSLQSLGLIKNEGPVTSLFLGMGFGTMENFYELDKLHLSFLSGNEKSLTTNYYKIFLQSSTGRITKGGDFIGSLRFSYYKDYMVMTDQDKLDVNLNGAFIEWALTSRFGYKYVKFFFTMGGSVRMPKIVFRETRISDEYIKLPHINGNTYAYNYLSLYASFGIHLNLFNKKYSNTK